jgi:hypothetical protein
LRTPPSWEENEKSDNFPVVLFRKPRKIDYRSFSKRLETFSTWPSENGQNVDELAKAGFFYTGFFCDKRLLIYHQVFS